MIRYTISSHQPSSHIFNVRLQFNPSDSLSHQLKLPCWIPGSYMLRDFSKHVVQLKLTQDCAAFYTLTKINADTWQIDQFHITQALDTISIEYDVYAWDRSVRGAHLDTTHAFINLSCLAFWVVGQENTPYEIVLEPPAIPQAATWRVATTLTPTGINEAGFGLYAAENYASLIDHPIEMGHFEKCSFLVNNIPHDIVITGQHHGDLDRLAQDLQKICQVHHDFFKDHNKHKIFNKYCFLLTLVGEGYGGLEHRSSTALISSRSSMPLYIDITQDITRSYNYDEYKNLLGLFSHEYFHAWHVKRIKPLVFCPYDLTQRQYTNQLWAFEGITSYYDELALVRAGVISREDYYSILSEAITKWMSIPGQKKQSLTEASFDAWIKFYKPDENTPNSSVSYYLKGMLAAFCFDMFLKKITNDKTSLDDVMRSLWMRYGDEQGVPEGEIERMIYLASNNSQEMAQLIHNALYTTKPLPLEEALAYVALNLDFNWASDFPIQVSLGIVVVEAAQELRISTVFDESAAMQAGLSAKDVIVAIDNLKVHTQYALERRLMYYQPNQEISIHVFREDNLMHFTLTLLPVMKNKAKITRNTQVGEDISENILRLEKWLSGK